jgi:hypothetical protein
VGATLDDLATFEHDDFIAVANRAQAMCDDDAGAAAPPQVVVDRLLGDRIERGSRLVQNEDRG